MRRLLPHVGALLGLVCLLAAAALALFATDARTWRSTFVRDDLRYRAIHGHVGLWQDATRIPADPAGRLLGVDDALLYRRALQLFFYSRVGADPESRRDLPTIRAEAQDALTQMMESGRTPAERTNAANLLGVLVVTSPVVDQDSQTQALIRAAGFFRRAVEIDPGNTQAKLNLELVLRLRRPGDSRFGQDARGGYGFGKGRGVGVTGSGY